MTPFCFVACLEIRKVFQRLRASPKTSFLLHHSVIQSSNRSIAPEEPPPLQGARSQALPIGQAEEGATAAVRGVVELIEKTHSPLSGDEGAGYEIDVLLKESEFRDFWLVDEFGDCAYVDTSEVRAVFQRYEVASVEEEREFLRQNHLEIQPHEVGKWCFRKENA